MSVRALIEQSLRSASAMALRYFGHVRGETKKDDPTQILTEADLAISRFLISRIKKAFPDHNIIDEEFGPLGRGSEYTWVIDPIDGTSNFAVGSPLYGIIIGLLKGTDPVAGGIALPSVGITCLAEKGRGAFLNGRRIHVSRERKLSASLISFSVDVVPGQPERTRRQMRTLGEIAIGSLSMRGSNSVFDAIMTAQGSYGVWLHERSKIWDNVGCHTIIIEAGGIYTDFLGRAMDYSNPLSRMKHNYSFCVGAPALHRQVQKIIAKRG